MGRHEKQRSSFRILTFIAALAIAGLFAGAALATENRATGLLEGFGSSNPPRQPVTSTAPPSTGLPSTSQTTPPPPGDAVGGGVVSILQCKPGPVHQVDPIVAPGGALSAHMHQFFGGRGVNPVGTPTTLTSMRTGGSTCPLTGDTAGYWVPTLINGSGTVVPPMSMNVYYRSPRGKGVSPFPEGFGIVCGIDKSRPECEASSSQNGGGWGCSDSESETTIAAALPCSDKLIAHVQINPTDPWLPKVTLHVRWKVTSGTGYHLASDMGAPGGSSLHGDFLNTWHPPLLQNVIDTLNAGKSCKGMTDAKVSCLL